MLVKGQFVSQEVFLNDLVQTRASYHVLSSSYEFLKWLSGFQLIIPITGMKIDFQSFQCLSIDLEPVLNCFLFWLYQFLILKTHLRGWKVSHPNRPSNYRNHWELNFSLIFMFFFSKMIKNCHSQKIHINIYILK